MNKQGQLGMQEILLVTFILVILFVLGLVLYFKFSLAHVQTIGETLSEQETTILLSRIHSLPELRCRDRVCLDTSRFIPFQTLTQRHQEYYANFLGYKKIVVTQLYPAPETRELCTLTTYEQDAYPQNCFSWTLYDHKPQKVRQQIIVRTFVSLYYPELEEYRLGEIEVITYA